ncbi:MAG: hypothetical protein ACLFUI_08490 [Halanaerobiales bacterium]
MPINMTRGLFPRQANVRRARQLPVQRIPRIAEVFEDLATESTVELIVYEDFLDLNPQVRRFPNLNPSQPIDTGERCTGSADHTGYDTDINDERTGSRRANRRDIIRGFRFG